MKNDSTSVSTHTLRRLATHDDYRACHELQKQTWGDSFAECVPPSLLMVSQKIGGVAAGAFDTHGTLLGFVFGLTGVKDGRLVHWSDMLAVRPEYRDHGIGRSLKNYQQQLVRAIGVEVIYWTYDPLVARNAHLNLNRLGARVTEYVPDMYASDAVGTLYSGMSMDRFVVAWDISNEANEADDAQRAQATQQRFADTLLINDNAKPITFEAEWPQATSLRIEIPRDIQIVKVEDMPRAIAWRTTTRAAFLHYQKMGYKVYGFFREAETGRCFYGLYKA